MAETTLIHEILARHGIAASPALMARQGLGAFTWQAGDFVVKIARDGCGDELRREAIVGPAARAAGVRTPCLVANGDGAYNVWQRVDGEPLGKTNDASQWREVGRQLARLHAIDHCEDARALLLRRNKRDARPHLHALAADRAAFFARWLDRLEDVPAADARLVHHDVHGLNVLCAADGATLIDWGDAGWADPASELGSVPMPYMTNLLAGYEEIASLGQEAEARILRAVIGHAVRKLAERGRERPLLDLMAFVTGDVSPRWRRWLPSDLL
jgi:Ser/Thr protein kinase RdoA (MazF antagonist)